VVRRSVNADGATGIETLCPEGKVATGGAAWVGTRIFFEATGQIFEVVRHDVSVHTQAHPASYRGMANVPPPGDYPPGSDPSTGGMASSFLETYVYCVEA
jgi:hypothetical protein